MFKLKSLFPTFVAVGTLPEASKINRLLLSQIDQFSSQDRMGRTWSKENYRGGYTSYASLSDLHQRAPIFSRFEEMIAQAAFLFAKKQGWRGMKKNLRMTDCWMNIMKRHTYHTLHFHPHSVISGVYYVKTPPGSISLKLEDPRMPYYMCAPLRESGPQENGLYYEIKPKAGMFVLFESWLRHEVPPNQSILPRICLSFNFAVGEEH